MRVVLILGVRVKVLFCDIEPNCCSVKKNVVFALIRRRNMCERVFIELIKTGEMWTSQLDS